VGWPPRCVLVNAGLAVVGCWGRACRAARPWRLAWYGTIDDYVDRRGASLLHLAAAGGPQLRRRNQWPAVVFLADSALVNGDAACRRCRYEAATLVACCCCVAGHERVSGSLQTAESVVPSLVV